VPNPSSNRLIDSYTPLNDPSQTVLDPSSQTGPECTALVFNGDVDSSLQVVNSDTGTSFCQAVICSRTGPSSSSEHEEASSEDGYRTAAPASAGSSSDTTVATGLDSSSNADYQRAAASTSCGLTTSLQGPPQPLVMRPS